MRQALFILLFAAVLAAALFTVRVLLIQPDEMALACEQLPGQWSCYLRSLLIQGFVRHLYGYVSIAAVALAWLSGWRVLSVIAMVAGIAGVVLYDFELAALGLLLGSLHLMRHGTKSQTAADAP